MYLYVLETIGIFLGIYFPRRLYWNKWAPPQGHGREEFCVIETIGIFLRNWNNMSSTHLSAKLAQRIFKKFGLNCQMKYMYYMTNI